MRARPATATPAIPAPTPTTWRGGARRSRCRRSSIRARCSSGCSATARSSAPRRARSAASTGAACSTSSPTTRARCSGEPRPDRSAQARRVPRARSVRSRSSWSGPSSENAQVDPGMEKPYGVPSDFAEHFKLMTDMITVAFQADLTRVVTFLVTREGTSRAYREIGIADGHHPLTHHRNIVEQMDKVAQINRYHVEQFAKWIGEAEGGAGRRRVAARQLDDRLRRRARRRQPAHAPRSADAHRRPWRRYFIKSGRRVVYRKETPMCNLFLTMMDRMGTRMDHFGDSTGPSERPRPHLAGGWIVDRRSSIVDRPSSIVRPGFSRALVDGRARL